MGQCTIYMQTKPRPTCLASGTNTCVDNEQCTHRGTVIICISLCATGNYS